MLLMLDNYDSFTFNLVQYFQQLGQQVVVKRNDQTSIEEITALQPQYLVISPGPKAPEHAGLSLAVMHHFVGKIPILGVCLGHQVIAQHFGASIIRADAPMHGKTSDISHQGQGVFRGLKQPLRVTRYHSLLVEADSLPSCLEITASHLSEQGQQQIMGLKHRSLAVEGVQFHPESVLTEQGLALLSNFVQQYR